ncbi:MAG: hypothetical protein MJ152_02425, partial [Clostridia bacterium]|nr:hypothetical protein [Clostridia bacterium]
MSTGEMSVAEYKGSNLESYINDQIVRVMPSEIICNQEMFTFSTKLPCSQGNEAYKFSTYYEWSFSFS